MNTNIRIAVATCLVLALGAGMAIAGGNSLAVTSPGLGGTNFKLSVTSTGVDANQTWVQDNSPVCEATYNYDVKIATPGLLLDADDKVLAINLRQESPAGVAIRCTLKQAVNGNNNVLNCISAKDGGGWQYAGKAPYGLNATPDIRLEYVRDSGGGDGIIRMFKNGNMVHEKLTYSNSSYCIDRFRMGITQNLPANTRPAGDFEFDNIVETR